MLITENLQDVEHWADELVHELHQLMDSEPTENTRLRMLSVVNELFSLLPVQFDAKTCDEYLRDVIDQFPNWDPQVQALWIEQAFLYEDLREIRDHLEQADDTPQDVDRLIPEVREWLVRMENHDHEERRLRQLAVNFEPGGQQ
jgi:hypothetical protein